MSDSPSPHDGLLSRAQALASGLVMAAATRFDAWRNPVTGRGTGRDKRIFTVAELELLSDEELSTLYRASPLHRRAVDLLPDECFRAGWEVRVPGDAALAQRINSQLADLKAQARLYEGYQKARKHGGGLVVVGTRDTSGRPADMLRPETVASVEWLNAYSSREAWARDYYGDMGARDYGEVASYQVSPLFGGWRGGWDVVHASRTLRFDGVPLDREERQAQQGWGDSVLQAVHEAIRDWADGYGGAAHLLQDSSQGVYKLKELTKLLLANRQDVVEQRMALFDFYKSNQRALLLGEEDEYTRVETSFTGVDGILMRLDFQLSACLGFPVTILLGQAPAGLNATGSADLETFRAAAAAAQMKFIRPELERLVKLLFLAKRGPSEGHEPPHWGIHFRPLSQPSTKETADTRLVHAQTDEIRIRSGVITAAVAATRLTGDEYADEVTVDKALHQPLPTEAAEEEEAARAQAQGLPEETVPDVEVPGVEGVEKVADTAFTGIQVKEAREIVAAVSRREFPREVGIGMLMEFFSLEEAQAERIMGPVGRSFFAETPPPPAPAAGPAAREDSAPPQRRRKKKQPEGGK